MKNALRSMLLGAAALSAAVAFAPRSEAGVHVGVQIGIPLPPPPVPRYVAPRPPVYVAPPYYRPAYGPYRTPYAYGRYAARPYGSVWVNGAWVLPPWPGAVWVDGHHGHRGYWSGGNRGHSRYR